MIPIFIIRAYYSISKAGSNKKPPPSGSFWVSHYFLLGGYHDSFNVSFHTNPWLFSRKKPTPKILEVQPTELTGALQWAADGAWVMRCGKGCLEDHPRYRKWLRSPPIYKPCRVPQPGNNPILRGLTITMVIKHLLAGMILQGWGGKGSQVVVGLKPNQCEQ